MLAPHDHCYCQAARRSARFLSRLYDRHLAPEGINIQQLSILSLVLRDPGMLIADLANQMVMERTTLLRALKPLQRAGLVVSAPSGTGRSLALKASRKGQRKAAHAVLLWREAQREFEALFGVAEARALRDAMRKAAALA